MQAQSSDYAHRVTDATSMYKAPDSSPHALPQHSMHSSRSCGCSPPTAPVTLHTYARPYHVPTSGTLTNRAHTCAHPLCVNQHTYKPDSPLQAPHTCSRRMPTAWARCAQLPGKQGLATSHPEESGVRCCSSSQPCTYADLFCPTPGYNNTTAAHGCCLCWLCEPSWG
jgi:hypothetical protein